MATRGPGITERDDGNDGSAASCLATVLPLVDAVYATSIYCQHMLVA